VCVHDWWEGSRWVIDDAADFQGTRLAAKRAVFVFLGEVAHEAVEGDKVRFVAAVNWAGEVDETSV
jgi:hypothetical protein